MYNMVSFKMWKNGDLQNKERWLIYCSQGSDMEKIRFQDSGDEAR